jgi:aminoglycoside phosphotransferase (APT) family kinase protein
LILAFARSQTYEPGSNVGTRDIEAWIFLLPRLDLDRVISVRAPSPATRRALTSFGAIIEERPVDELTAALERARVAVVAGSAIERVARDPAAVGALNGFLARGGTVYLEPSQTGRVELATRLGVSSWVQLAPPVPETGRREPAQGLRSAWLVPRTRTRPAPLIDRVKSVARLRPAGTSSDVRLTPTRAAAPSTDRLGVLVRPASAPGLPEYVCAVARSCGHDLDSVSDWTMTPPRGYRSQKVVFDTGDQGVIVKLTQDRRFNDRLDNEYSALRELERRDLPGLRDGRLAPKPLFRGHHAGLLMVGESRIVGRPFRQRSDGSAACPVARATLDALVMLSTASTETRSGGDVAEALSDLVEQHARVHKPPPRQLDFLQRQLERFGEQRPAFPSPFSHGDPSTLNVLVADDGGIGLVDWENAEPAGLPLWDLLYFVNAYAAWNAELAGRRWRPEAAREALLQPSPFHTLLRAAVDRYRSAVGLSAALVPPLVFCFWMAFALREATRRPPGRAAEGLYASLLAALVKDGERSVASLAAEVRR